MPSGAPTFFMIAKTAMGSVGAIRAPNSMAYINDSSRPRASIRAKVPRPTSTVVSTTPAVAKHRISKVCLRRCDSCTCRAPAKSKKPSSPCISVSLKSIEPTT